MADDQRERVFGFSALLGALLLCLGAGVAGWMVSVGGWECIALAALSAPAALHLSTGSIRLLMRLLLQPREENRRSPLDPGGVPVVVPVILRSARDVETVASCVEFNRPHAGPMPMILLVDGRDADAADAPDDATVLRALTSRLAHLLASGQVIIMRRRRRWDAVDRVWRGWERKRGKIEEFCLLLRGRAGTSFADPLPSVLRGVAGFVTIDVDSRLTGTTVARLAGAARGRSAIVVPVIEDVRSRHPTLFEQLQAPYWCTRPFKPRLGFSQQYLGRDLFFGKGLILVDRFLEGTAGRIAERTVLSHDHLEAMLVGAVSEPTAVIREAVPASRRQWERRQHRWMRGDYQIVPWIAAGSLSVFARLQLAVIVGAQAAAPASLAAIMVALIAADAPAAGWIVVAALILVRPSLLLMPLEAVRFLADDKETWRGRLRDVGALAVTELSSWMLAVAYLPRDAALSTHAMAVVAWRRLVSGRRLLDWDDAAAGPPSGRWFAPMQLLFGASCGIAGLRLAGPFALAAVLMAVWSLLPVILEIKARASSAAGAGVGGAARSAT